MAAKKKPKGPLEVAREAALMGDAEAAIAGLTPLAAADASAAASLAELLAFRGDWEGVADNAARLIENPSAVYAANVFDDMVRLVAIAGHHGVPWARVGEIAAAGLVVAEKETRAHVATRHRTILADLAAYAARSGAPPHERISVFGVVTPQPTREQYQAAVATALKKPKPKPEAQARHLIALAASFRQPDELVRLVTESPGHAGFDHVIEAARTIASRGDGGAAWALLQPQLPGFYPVDVAQVAPVVLLTDPDLRSLITPERAAVVLSTPRAGR